MFEIQHQRARAGSERLTRYCQRDAARLSHEQREAELLFEFLNLQRQWWLLYMKSCGGARQLAFFGNR
jgi:hypothetical protein